MASQAQAASPAHRSTRREWLNDDTMFIFCGGLACTYFFRDALTGALRYYLSQVGLSVLWFVPDVLTLVVLAYFTKGIVLRSNSIFGWVILLNCVTAIAISSVFMSPGAFAFVSSLKLFLPIFVGFALCGRSLTDVTWMRRLIFLAMTASVVGLLLSPHVAFPWTGASIDNFGEAKVTGRMWWTQGEVRHGGFAGDNTMAAYMCLFPYFLLHRHFSRLTNVLLWIPIGIAIDLSTSKTALGTGIVFAIYYVLVYFVFPNANILKITRRLAKYSFFFVPLPFILMVSAAGVDLTSISVQLFSMQDRINNTWSFPFTYMLDYYPAGIITGCGLGCFTYPMDYTEMAYLNVPVDSFFVASYVMFGVPLIFTIIGMFTATLKSNDRDKLLLIAITNVYVVTVQCYGPSTSTLLIGYAFSDMFLTSVRAWRRRGTGEADEAPAAVGEPPVRPWRRVSASR